MDHEQFLKLDARWSEPSKVQENRAIWFQTYNETSHKTNAVKSSGD